MKTFILAFFALAQAGIVLANTSTYSSYLAAREASRNQHKDLVILFTNTQCQPCEKIWEDFLKTNGNEVIGLRVDADDFDGKVLFDRFDRTSCPSWVILDPAGSIKKSWNGDWNGNAVTASPSSPTPKKEAVPSNPIPQPVKTDPVVSESTPTTSTGTQPVVTSSSTSVKPVQSTGNYVIQTGYFGSQANAEKQVADLSVMGFNQFEIKPTVRDNGTFYRVISTGFDTESAADQVIRQLAAKSIKSTLKTGAEVAQ